MGSKNLEKEDGGFLKKNNGKDLGNEGKNKKTDEAVFVFIWGI